MNGKMNNINFIRKIAWSFHRSTGLDWDDLFQEAALAYYKALDTYDPSRGKITTYMWWVIISHLKNYLQEQSKWNGNILSVDEVDIDKPVEHTPMFEKLTNDAQQIANVVLQSPRTFAHMQPVKAHQRIAQKMIQRGWRWGRVWRAMRDLKLAMSNQ